jgi:hypothetical protein
MYICMHKKLSPQKIAFGKSVDRFFLFKSEHEIFWRNENLSERFSAELVF